MHPSAPAALLGLLLAAAPAQDAAQRKRFTNLAGSFAIDLPNNYRQLAPNEALTLSERPGTPAELRSTSPHRFYAIGPVDRWLSGQLESPWIYVMEQDGEWHIDGDFATLLAERWRENGQLSATEHRVTDVRAAEVGPNRHPVHLARRTSSAAGRRAVTSLDVYAATGGRQITLSFGAFAEDFERWAPDFEQWLGTLAFARQPRGQQKLSDRLWTPILTGALVGVVLLLLYKHTKRSR